MRLPSLLDALLIHRSAIAAVTPDEGSKWMAPEELEPL